MEVGVDWELDFEEKVEEDYEEYKKDLDLIKHWWYNQITVMNLNMIPIKEHNDLVEKLMKEISTKEQ